MGMIGLSNIHNAVKINKAQ